MCQNVCYFVKEQFKLLVTFSPIIMADTKISDLNINLLPDEKEIFTSKSYRTNGQNLPPLTKGYYLDFASAFL